MKPETRQRREEEKQYEKIEGILAKAEDKGGRFFAISMMRIGFSFGDEADKEAAASLVADRFRLSIREVREWYDVYWSKKSCKLGVY